MKKQPLISIILPFRNEIKELGETLQSFIDQTYKNKEVILVDSDSNDGSTEIAKAFAKKYKWIKYFNNPPKPGKWATEYYIDAITSAKGEVIYMADANGKIMPDYLELTVPLIKGDVAGVVGKVIIWPSNKWIPRFRDVLWTLRYNNTPRMQREINAGGILPRTFSRAAYDKVGGFNPQAGWAIDTFFNKALLKHSYKIIYEPKAEWWHKWRDDPKILIRYSYKFGKLNHDLIRTEKKQLLKIAFFLSPVVFLIIGFFNSLFFLYLIVHPALIMIKYIKLFIKARGHKNRYYVLLGPIISYMQNIPYALGFLRSLIMPKRR